MLFPIYMVVLTSLSTQEAVTEAGGLVTVPGELVPRRLRELFSGGVVTRAVLVSLGVTVVGTALSLVVTVLAAYGLSRPGSLLHRPILFLVLLTFLFAPGMIPSYLVVSSLGLMDSYWALILPTAGQRVQPGRHARVLHEHPAGADRQRPDRRRKRVRASCAGSCCRCPRASSRSSGCSTPSATGTPSSTRSSTSTTTPSGRCSWCCASTSSQGQSIYAGQGGVTTVGQALPPSLAIQMAIVVIALVPVLFIYPFVQKHFTKGVVIGAVKG